VDADVLIAELLRAPPKLHSHETGVVNWGIDPELVPHLKRLVKPGMRTLETGSGLSTIVLLALGADHRAVSPDPAEPDRIRAYCQGKGISVERYVHVIARSESHLPTLPPDPVLDFVLVDGDHAFPVPSIDWFYASRLLKKDGVCVIDDAQLWSVRVLVDFLTGDDAWETLEQTPRFAAFRLRLEAKDALSRWWEQQPYVVKMSEPESKRGLLGRIFKR
jgi:Methyltransferase domain